VLLAMGLSSFSSSLANGPAGVLYGLGQARATFRINLAKGPVLLLALLACTWAGGAVGAAWALAAIEALVLPAWILTMLRTLRARDAQHSDEVTPALAGVMQR
jgi:O-antigen/teichoic acid export membrane protein